VDDQIELLSRRFERERLARKEAEKITESKSRELFIKNEELQRLASAEAQARKEAEVLRKALEAFTSKLDRDEIAACLGNFLHELIKCDGYAVYFLGGDGMRLYNVWGDSQHFREVGMAMHPDILAKIKQSNLPITDADVASVVDKLDMHPETQKWMILPILSNGVCIGCITLESRQKDVFNERETKFIHALANETAIALENARLFEEVEWLSKIDPLTNLYNRRYFNSAARQEFERAQRYNLPLSAIIMDLDHFKRVNDTYGHGAGDEVLVKVASACLHSIRLSDIHARHGGEEFCFLLPQTDLNAACKLAERLRSAVADLNFKFNGVSFKVTASLGVAERTEGDNSMESLINRSDQALYKAKESGRNRIAVL
jgi:diguanylate cyclase (GGDEF)-like protein